MKKAILIMGKTYAFHWKTRNRQGYVVTYVFFEPAAKSKFLMVQEPKMLESAAPCAECQDGRDLSGMSIFLSEEG